MSDTHSDFFQRQDRARSKTRLLVLLFGLAVLGIIAVLYVATVLTMGGPLWNPEYLLWTAGGVVVVVGLASALKMAELSQGGSAVASMLGGQQVDVNTTDPKLRQLLNVVEEMAIASGVPVPTVYVLAEDRTINAFAAGHTPGDAVIGVTRGTLERLTRDELQGVIAHEFSHVLNGDMRLNIRLMGVLFGILCLAILGQILLRSSVYMRIGSSRDRNAGAAMLALVVAGFVLFLVGWIGVFFAKLIKAAVSRQREFLADASAVQFTRNPEGIAGALYKIGKFSAKIQSPHAEEASHMFFGNGLGDSWFTLFATHPPIPDRIRAIAPNFDPSGVRDIKPPPRPTDGKAAPVPRNWIGHAGAPGNLHVAHAAALLSAMPQDAMAAAHEFHDATALVYALLLDDKEEIRTKQLEALQAEPPALKKTAEIFAGRGRLSHEQQITLVDLAIPTLRGLSPEAYARFRANVEALIAADGQIHLFEFLLEKILVRHLDMHFTRRTGTAVKFSSLGPLLGDVAALLSALAALGHEGEEERERAYAGGVRELMVNAGNPALKRIPAPGIAELSPALDRIAMAAPRVKRQILTACGQTAMHDGKLSDGQAQLLRAIADAVDCPVPPFVSVGGAAR